MRKTNYTRVTLLLLTDLQYWAQCRPDISATVREALPHLGEEEIEIYHSVIRRWIHPGEEACDFVERARGVAVMIQRGQMAAAAGKLLGSTAASPARWPDSIVWCAGSAIVFLFRTWG